MFKKSPEKVEWCKLCDNRWKKHSRTTHAYFGWLSWYPMIVEKWKYHHWIRLIETVLTVPNSSFHDYWMPRYWTKRLRIGVFHFAKLRHIARSEKRRSEDVLPNISASSDCRRMNLVPLEPSRWDESNGGIFIFLRSLDTKIFNKMSKL